MRWIERLRRDDQRVKATPSRVAASLAEGVTRSTNLLRIRVQEEGFSLTDRKRFESEACILECRPSDLRGTWTEADSLRRSFWISRGFIVSASPSIGRHSERVSRCKSWGSGPGCGSRTLTSRATG